MNTFVVNNIEWKVYRVPALTPFLKRSNNTYTLGVTDNNTHSIYIDKELRGKLLEKVLCHEICHAFMFSYNIEIPIDQEEFLANWISVYGRSVIEILDMLLIQTNNSLNVI